MSANNAKQRQRATPGKGARAGGAKARANAGKAARQLRKPGMSTNLKVTLAARAART